MTEQTEELVNEQVETIIEEEPKEYKIGDIFYGTYEPEVAVWCNEHNAVIVELEPEEEQRVFQIQEIPVHIPTNEEQRIARANAYVNEIDPLHSQKQRRTILGTWTDEDEAEYIEKVKTLSEEINNRYPYMEN